MATLSRTSAWLATLLVLAAVLQDFVTSESIKLCEKHDEKIADRKSCTRYHLCKQQEDGSMISAIAVCPDDHVFDLVNETCVAVDPGSAYLQDPDSCRTFYGCTKVKAFNGYVRSHYKCPGTLRFHPGLKYCTIETNVPDDMCTTDMPSKPIVGTYEPMSTSTTSVTPVVTEAPPTSGSTDSGSAGSGTTNAGTADSGTTDGGSADSGSTDSGSADSGSADSGSTDPSSTDSTSPDSGLTDAPSEEVRLDTVVPRPLSDLTDIQRITQVIRGQLLNRKKQESVNKS